MAEGDLTSGERARLDAALLEPAGQLTPRGRAEWLGQLTGVAFTSDGALPFRDNVDHAHRHGVRYIAEPSGASRSSDVADAAGSMGSPSRTGLRLFHH